MPVPNILWIVTTQWRAQAFGHAGDPNARTPNLDALAAESADFSQAVTPHPFGPFARAAMLTGVPSPQNGVRDYFDPLPLNARTIAHELRDRGYATAYFGKWHLAPRDPAAPLVGEAHAKTIVPPERRGGFEFWEGCESGFLLNDPWLHGSRLIEPVRFPGYQSDVLCRRALEVLRSADCGVRSDGKPDDPDGVSSPIRTPHSAVRNGTKPTFTVVSLESPHPPYDAPLPPGIVAPDPASLVLPTNVPRGGEVEVRARRELAGYYGHVEATDRAIGRLIRGVDEADAHRDQSTLIVFTSVHGDMHGAHGLFRKGWPYEESLRIPFLARLPRQKSVALRTSDAGGVVSTAAVSLLDLPKLTLEAIERSEIALWTLPQAASVSMPSVVALPHQCDRVWRGIRTPTRKLILNADGSPWLFFDLEKDPLELQNLAADPSCRREQDALRAQVPS